MQIAIDGPSGAGKSTIAKEISKKLNIEYLDTGAMYRTLALYFDRHNFKEFDNKDLLIDELNKIDIDVRNDKFYLFDEDVTSIIRTEEISKLASKISAYKEVRGFLVEKQQQIANNRDIIMDGRDVGTVILKNADYKIFLTADINERAKRRFDELKVKNINVLYEDVKLDLEKRDFNDMNRANSPLIKAEDSIEIDSTNKNIVEIVDEIIKLINKEDK